ncbi:TorF family putative porin [Bordetella sp. 02P26C-1]|uniref:TorF family putative porin n=1 Tax=Bordetella sp. 02P26C-1 TaxID=2683195 RepID=UPI0013549174|nr:TorF family putative porin [Bordetella sp. 02P26C-1]MVW79083.1 hypothetical protein [Bordetella sp. 02P26C-1]
MRSSYIAMALGLALGVSSYAHAQSQREDTQPPSYWTPDLAIGADFGSDSMFRGQSQTRGKPGMTAQAVASLGPLYAGAIWMNRDYGKHDPTTAETDLLAGVSPSYGPFRFDFNALRVHFTHNASSDYWEYKAGAETDLPLGITAALNYYHSPNYYNAHTKENVYELTLDKPLNTKWSLSGSVGLARFTGHDAPNSYKWFDAGIDYHITPDLKAGLKYYTTTLGRADCAPANACHSRVVLELSWSTTLRSLLSKD